jgi:hypothetical protein
MFPRHHAAAAAPSASPPVDEISQERVQRAVGGSIAPVSTWR